MRRITAVVLIAVMLLTAVILAVGVLLAPVSPFEYEDSLREISLAEALQNKTDKPNEPLTPLGDGKRYIVKFKSDVSLDVIKKALSNTDYRLLAESEYRLFAVQTDDIELLNNNIIEYYEPDLIRDTLAVTDDAVSPEYYDSHGISSAWDITRGSSSVIVAVLDTGVARNHEDLAGANILAGYDAVSRVSGVYEDSAGHGTGVIGIIAATADNKKGIAGVAHGVAVLPVRVAATSNSIYSSDLISGIRFAADAGAKIINMSVGGYSASYAEQDAVNYAVSKGCILISAAGNGGNRPYADQKSYPASYEGVISVASCNANGERSSFSQYNDSVDVAAIGENITMPFTENGESIYRTDSGTSYSCAIVSGIAALAASRIDANVRFGSAEFLALVAEYCGQNRTNELGHGVINAYPIVNNVNFPIITGVYNNGVYAESVHAYFNRGEATLNGEEFIDGDAIIKNGRHTLVVRDGDFSKIISFRLNYSPLTYKYEEFASFAYFEFERGKARLDGFPYTSGERISASGKHIFVLTDGDESIRKEIYLQYSMPSVYGIEDGGSYDHPVNIRIIGDGGATLDGTKIYGEATVATNGTHILEVFNGIGSESQIYEFDINIDGASFIKNDYAMSLSFVDEANGFICIYGESLTGARIYAIESPERFAHFIASGNIYGHGANDNELYLFGENGITVIDRKNALSPENAVLRTFSPEGTEYFVYHGSSIFAFGNRTMYTVDTESGEATEIYTLGFDCKKAFSDGDTLYLVSDDGNVYAYRENNAEIVPNINVKDMTVCIGDGFLASGNRLYDIASGDLLLEFAAENGVKIENGLLFSERSIIDIVSGKEIGVFEFEISDIVFGENGIYLFGREMRYGFVPSGKEGVFAYGAAVPTNNAFSQHDDVNIYRKNLYYDINEKLISACAEGEKVFAIFENRHYLYRFSTDGYNAFEAVSLKYRPDNVFALGGYIAVTFKNINRIYIASNDDIQNGSYITLQSSCSSAFGTNGRIYACVGGRLVHFLPDGSGMTTTDISAQSGCSNGNFFYLLDGEKLSLYRTNLGYVSSITVKNGALYCGDNAVAVGNIVYSPDLSDELLQTDGEVIATRGNTAITATGVYDIVSAVQIGSTGVKRATKAIISENNSLLTFGDGMISVCSFGDGRDIVSLPTIEGIEENGIYLDSVVIGYEAGVGYLDGVALESGGTASGAGRHTFELVLPCGRNIKIDFTIESHIERIEFLVPDRVMSVGETVTLRVRYLPDGASSVPVSFYCDSEGISVSELGEITALSVGEYTVTATAVTEYGEFSAECRITVRDDLIVFDSESSLSVDRDGGYILNIEPDTSADKLIANIVASGEIVITDKEGNLVTDTVGTGDIISLYSGGEITDSLVAVVVGDTDGDGFISAYDLYVLERILRDEDYANEFILASDVNKNGIVADNDYRDLKNMILRIVESRLGTPPNGLFGLATVQTPSRIEHGSIINVVVCISGGKYTRAVSGLIDFSDGLEFIDGFSTGWQTDYRELDKRVSFYAFGNDGQVCGKAFKTLINLRFRVTAEAGSTVSFSSDGLTCTSEKDCSVMRFETTELFVYESREGDFDIEIGNAYDFEFSKGKHEYDVTIPYNSALADISVVTPKGYSVSISSPVINDSGVNTITVTLTDSNGRATVYTFNVKREAEPRFDTNCRLSNLEIEGFRLSPSFDPDVLLYSITVPYDTEKIIVYCAAQNPTAKVIIGDTTLYGDETNVVIIVGSPDGETLKYVIRVIRQPNDDISDSDVGSDNSDGSGKRRTYIIIIIGVLIAALLIPVYLRFANRDEEIKQNEEKENRTDGETNSESFDESDLQEPENKNNE